MPFIVAFLGVLALLLADLELQICDVIRSTGAKVDKVWSVPSGSVTFIRASKPRLVSSMRGVLASWRVLIRLSSHSGDASMLDEPCDQFFSLDPMDFQLAAIDELVHFLKQAPCSRVIL